MKVTKDRIIGFCCNECAYAAADLAGQSGMKYPTNVRIIRTPCSGSTDPLWVLEGLADGAKGVFVSGCLPDQCHYGDGNVHAEQNVQFIQQLLKAVGINPKHVTAYFNSAGMPEAFSNSTTNFVEETISLPDLPVIKDKIKSTDKRQRFLEILIAYATATGKINDINEKPILKEGFGKITVDENKCVSCGACANLCEPKAITTKETKKHRKMYYSHYLCTGCEACIRACPTEAITLVKELDLKPFLLKETNQFSGSELINCKECGEVFSTKAILEKVESQFELLDSSLFSLCPACRREVIGQDFIKLKEYLSTAEVFSEEVTK